MTTVTIPKTKYEILEKQSLLYKKILKGFDGQFFGIEEYSPKRLKEFLREDKVGSKLRTQIIKLLKNS